MYAGEGCPADKFLSSFLRDAGHRQQLRNPRPPAKLIRFLEGGWPNQYFNHALNELQSVMGNVNDAIGHYQNHPCRDLVVGGMKTSRGEDGNLQIAIDVSQYKPEEISVKLCDDDLIVEAKTESSEDDSYYKAEFKRSIKLPQDVRHEGIRSKITPDNKLLIEVPCNRPIESRGRSIPIEVQRKNEAVEGAGKQQDQQSNGQQQEQKAD